MIPRSRSKGKHQTLFDRGTHSERLGQLHRWLTHLALSVNTMEKFCWGSSLFSVKAE
jgi:hypothetical protein